MNPNKYRLAVSAQYFLYFGVMGIYLPYFNLYCYHLGFNGFQIGILSALRSVTLVVFPLIWGHLADRWRKRRKIYILCNIISAAVWSLYLLTADFWLMLAIAACYGIFFAPIISFLEAFTMDVLGPEKRSYGSIRAWGSISFIVTVTVLGKVIDMFSVDIIVRFILIGSMLLAALSCCIPDTVTWSKSARKEDAGCLLKKRLVVFLLSAFLMLVSHGAYYGFFSIHLENLGVRSTYIGLAWALASTAEIGVMLRSKKLFNRFSIERVLILSFGVAALRWLILFWTDSTVMIMLSQVLHAVTYGMFHMASILYIDRLAPEGSKTLGQAVNNALSYGLGLMVGFFVNGYLYEILGSQALFGIASGIALAGGVLFTAFQVIQKNLKTQSA